MLSSTQTDSPLPPKCNRCCKSSSKYLNINKTSVTGKEACSCSKGVKTCARGPKVHKKVQQRKRPQCNVCGKIFSYKYSLIMHNYVHTREKLYTCKICPKRFSQKGNMQTHMRIHEGFNKLFSCEICGKRFSQKGNMMTHMKIHSGLKPYVCPVCSKRFIQKVNMIKHVAYHHNTPSEKNKIINPLIKSEPNLTRQAPRNQIFLTPPSTITGLSNISQELSFVCKVCAMIFTISSDLKTHMESHTEQTMRYPCPICKRSYSFKHNMKAHMKSHSIQFCHVCGKGFNQKSVMKKHMDLHLKPQGKENVKNKLSRRSSSSAEHQLGEMIKTEFNCLIETNKNLGLPEFSAHRHQSKNPERPQLKESSGKKCSVMLNFNYQERLSMKEWEQGLRRQKTEERQANGNPSAQHRNRKSEKHQFGGSLQKCCSVKLFRHNLNYQDRFSMIELGQPQGQKTEEKRNDVIPSSILLCHLKRPEKILLKFSRQSLNLPVLFEEKNALTTSIQRKRDVLEMNYSETSVISKEGCSKKMEPSGHQNASSLKNRLIFTWTDELNWSANENGNGAPLKSCQRSCQRLSSGNRERRTPSTESLNSVPCLGTRFKQEIKTETEDYEKSLQDDGKDRKVTTVFDETALVKLDLKDERNGRSEMRESNLRGTPYELAVKIKQEPGANENQEKEPNQTEMVQDAQLDARHPNIQKPLQQAEVQESQKPIGAQNKSVKQEQTTLPTVVLEDLREKMSEILSSQEDRLQQKEDAIEKPTSSKDNVHIIKMFEDNKSMDESRKLKSCEELLTDDISPAPVAMEVENENVEDSIKAVAPTQPGDKPDIDKENVPPAPRGFLLQYLQFLGTPHTPEETAPEETPQTSQLDNRESDKEIKEEPMEVAEVHPPIEKKPAVTAWRCKGDLFLQDKPCYEIISKLPKCRECRRAPNRRRKQSNILCRFYAFRKLKCGKSGAVSSVGFSEPLDATPEDLKLWLPPVDLPPKDLDLETSKLLLAHIGDQFCDLVEQEREAKALHMGQDKTMAWKRIVQGVREMCDVCETTLFNIHWVCCKCGFVVCIDCYQARKNGTAKEEQAPPKDRDEFQWLLCGRSQPHAQEKLMLTQIIAGNALWDVGQQLHETKRKWNIPSYCVCTRNTNQEEDKSPIIGNGVCTKLMSSASESFLTSKMASKGFTKNLPCSKYKWGKNGGKTPSLNELATLINQDEQYGIGMYYNSQNCRTSLDWLADAALNTLEGMNSESLNMEQNYRRHLPAGLCESNFSALSDLLIESPSKDRNNNHVGKSEVGSMKALGSTLDEVISCLLEQRVGKVKNKEMDELMHFRRRYPSCLQGREPMPIRVGTLTESSLLYPGVPHVWLCNGRLLLLLEHRNEGNLAIFQDQWKRGQPVVVAEMDKHLDMTLWHPDGFCRDFGDIKNDLVNCMTGTVLLNHPMRKFWDGFENFGKRMKDDNGDYMLLKLKDWPPGEDFSELMPTRFQNLMGALPLHQYTHRNGLLNLAGRLPDFFVRPDLGPKMYIAYGSALYPTKGTTNLHLDISDAVNVMVYVGIPKDGKDEEHIQEALRAIDEGGCDSLMRKRVREEGVKPGALWHIYNARDADKIRDLLNKVAVEQGEILESHHDPIHDQSWYLTTELRERLSREYNVEGYAIAQCLGDSVFIPAGAPHQVRNLHSCVKIAEDFVSPENIAHCVTLTQEFRNLSETHLNHEDKLQIKNIIYHSVRDAMALLKAADQSNSQGC